MNKYVKGSIATLALLTASVWGINDASATTVDMSTFYSGEQLANPTSGSSWLTADIVNNGEIGTSGTYSYTMTLTSYLANQEFVGGVNKTIGWAFEFQNQLTNVANTGGVNSLKTTNGTSTTANDPNILTGPVPGPFNFALYFGANNFTTGSSSTWTFDSTANMTQLTDFFGNGNTDGIYSAAHIQGIQGNGTTCSAWIVNSGQISGTSAPTTCGGGTTQVPEPSELPLMALGLSLIASGLYMRKKRQG